MQDWALTCADSSKMYGSEIILKTSACQGTPPLEARPNSLKVWDEFEATVFLLHLRSRCRKLHTKSQRVEKSA